MVGKTDVKERVGGGALAVLDLAADAGAGMEGADKDSFALPFLAVLQGLSPQLETVEGAKPGLLINTVTNEVMAKARVVPVAFQRKYIRWTPRDAGGGYKGEYTVAAVEQMIKDRVLEDDRENNVLLIDAGKDQPKDEVRDTRVHFVLILRDGGWTPAVMSMGRTQIKHSKRWMSQINGIQVKNGEGKLVVPASFSHVYAVSTKKEKNKEGEWHSFNINIEGPVQDRALYDAAKDLYKHVMAGKVTAKHEAEPGAGNTEGDRGGKF